MPVLGPVLTYGLPLELKSVPLGPSHIYWVANGITDVLMLAVVPKHADAGKPVIGGLGTFTLGGALLMWPMLYKMVDTQPFASYTSICWLLPSHWLSVNTPLVESDTVLKFASKNR